MVQLYIKHVDNNFYLLDLEDSESINYKLTVKDLTDITKVYSPFTQSFNIKATDKNKILCGFEGNEKMTKSNTTGEFDSMIYISGFLFQSGKLTFSESNYELQDQKDFKVSFASNLTSLTDRLGDTTIQQLFQDENGDFDDALKIDWNVFTLKDRLSSVKNTTLSNGIEFKYGIPFISNLRTWVFDDSNYDIIDNLAYIKSKNWFNSNQVRLVEVRPAVNYMAIMNHLLIKIGTPVICPIFDRPEVKDIFAWCSSASLIVPDAAAYPLLNYDSLIYSRYDEKDEVSGVGIPSNPKWDITGGGSSGIFKVKRNEVVENPDKWSDGFDVNVIFNNLISLESGPTKIKVSAINALNNIPLDSQDVEGNTYTFRVLDSQLDENGELYIRITILPSTLLSWDSLKFETIQKFRYSRGGIGGNRVTRATYSASATNVTDSSTVGGNKLNLISALPKMKCTDFLKSFFNTFNISVVSTGLNDQSMYWLTPSDIQEVNKPYSKRIIDYTSFVDISTYKKEKSNQYNQYLFSHFDSKYYDAIYGDGTRFGNLMYPPVTPKKPTKFEVKTSYSLIKQSPVFNHPSSAKMCLGFTRDTPEILDSGGYVYKPAFDEFTIFYLQGKDLGIDTLSVEYTDTENNKLSSILEASFRNSFNGKTLGFGAAEGFDDSLYLEYYKTFIEMLLKVNTNKSSFTLTLPANEIFLNFANLNQGESNIPTGFRSQNEIIIGEQKYNLIDSAIDLTTGKTKLTVLNF